MSERSREAVFDAIVESLASAESMSEEWRSTIGRGLRRKAIGYGLRELLAGWVERRPVNTKIVEAALAELDLELAE